MKNLEGTARLSSQGRLRKLLSTEFPDADQAYDLFDQFLAQEAYNKRFYLRLLALAKQKTGASWAIRRLAVLMLEHQTLKLHPNNLDGFDFLLTELNLKQASGISQSIVGSVLKEGFSTTEFRSFIAEFRHRLARLNHVHGRIKGHGTTGAALRDFIELSRRDCKLSLARYLFTPAEVVDEILRQVQATAGVTDLDPSQLPFVDDETRRTLNLLPEFEARILRGLCKTSSIFWVSEATSSRINSLVEYPTTTVVLVIKPPGSDIEFEIKRAGLRGPHSLNVVYARDGYTVPPSHRLDGGSMQYLLRVEAHSACKLGVIYRLVHGNEAPLTKYISRSTIYNIPVKGREVSALTYFTDSRVFGAGFSEMRRAMEEGVAQFKVEGYPSLPSLPGDLGLSAKFIGVAAPTQAILSGTSSFRLDKIAAYLSSNGPTQYFKEELKVAYSSDEARRLVYAILEEILGSPRLPAVEYVSHEQYVAAAFCVPENRARADQMYLALVQQIARMWGTLLAVRGYSQGESFVARNVGLKSFWDKGEWQVKIIFMDHDALVVPRAYEEDFHPHRALGGMIKDERYIWGRGDPAQFVTSEVGYLRNIYRIGEDIDAKSQALAQAALKNAYQKTQRGLLTNRNLRTLFHKTFIDRLLVWDSLVAGYLRTRNDTEGSPIWREDMRRLLAAKGYGNFRFSLDAHLEIIENNRQFLQRYSYLFDVDRKDIGRN